MRTTIGAAALALAAGLAWAATGGQEFPKPGKEHEFLKRFEGRWTGVTRFQSGPAGRACVGKGEDRNVLGCEGLWLLVDSKGEMMGAPYHGHGMMGYDTEKKKFVVAFVDNTSTSLQ